MPTLAYTKPNNLPQLYGELTAAIPALVPLEGTTHFVVSGLGQQIWITVPDSVASSAVNTVVAAHTPVYPAVADPFATALTALGAAATVADVTGALTPLLTALRAERVR